jgi:hypothetical protein
MHSLIGKIPVGRQAPENLLGASKLEFDVSCLRAVAFASSTVLSSEYRLDATAWGKTEEIGVAELRRCGRA